MRTRARAYHKDCPKGKLFFDTDELEKAYVEGWVDAEWKVGQTVNKEDIIASPVPEQKLCECGCGTPVKKRFALGHYYRKTIKKDIKHGDHKNHKPPD